jgi:deoxyribodipyrimidine photolyase
LAKFEKFNGTYARMTAIVWYRDDLRVSDHFALSAAAKSHAPVAFIYVLDDKAPGVRPLGAMVAGAIVARPASEPA